MMFDFNRVDTDGLQAWCSTCCSTSASEVRRRKCRGESLRRDGEVVSELFRWGSNHGRFRSAGDGAEGLQGLSLEPQLPPSLIGEVDDGRVLPESIISFVVGPSSKNQPSG